MNVRRRSGEVVTGYLTTIVVATAQKSFLAA
jgi:hypothetical protein